MFAVARQPALHALLNTLFQAAGHVTPVQAIVRFAAVQVSVRRAKQAIS